MPFLSPRRLISHPDTQTCPFHFFLARGRKRTQEVLCRAAVGVETPHPSRQLNLMLGDETGNRCHPWPSVLKHYRPHNQGRSKGGRGGLVSSQATSPFILPLTNIRVTPPSHICHFPVFLASIQHYPVTQRFSWVHPGLTWTQKDDPSDNEGNTK